jgi:3-hydroxyisobutyrate dehydrogenase
MKVGFLGTGVMGQPMALNLARAGTELIVWNRSAEKCEPLRELGAVVASSPDEVFRAARVVIVMLAHEQAIEEVLRGDLSRVAGRIVVNMGTVSAGFSSALEREIVSAGGQYVEAPVSGSRKPAESGQLIGMLAGEPSAVEEVRPLLRAMCAETFICGAVPRALLMKLSVNLFLITMVTGLAESAHVAQRYGLDLATFAQILNAGPMASSVSKMKLAKLVTRDFSVQASIRDVSMNASLVANAAHQIGAASPLIDVCTELFAAAANSGRGAIDMAGVIEVLEERSGLGE